jgi:hypothetical protein
MGEGRRNNLDVTGSVQTTDADAVAAEVIRLFHGLFRDEGAGALERAFRDVADLYAGKHPEYWPCDTEYHDLQHVLDVTLAMARIMDGYHQARSESESPLTPELFTMGVVAALFHDFGYLRRRSDYRHRYGAEYTMTHVSRSAGFLRQYVVGLGLGVPIARAASNVVHFTGYEQQAHNIRLSSELMRRLGQMLGTADIIAQMSDRCYLEKCRDRLYPEFLLARRTAERRGARPGLFAFASGAELVHKTPDFYKTATRRMNVELAGAYAYAERHFGGANLYLEAMQKNVRYAEAIAEGPGAATSLRRQPPNTLIPGVEPYPKELLA